MHHSEYLCTHRPSRMWMLATAVVLVLVSDSALADGEDLLLLPIGQLGVICAVALACRDLFRSVWWWLLGVSVTMVTWGFTGLGVWYGGYTPKFADTARRYFAYGSLVPLLAFGLVIGIGWGFQKLRKSDKSKPMIVPILKGLHSADLLRPETPKVAEFAVVMQASIGPKDENGAETFSFTVATPAFVASLGLPRWGHGLLLVQSFSWQEVDRYVERLLARAHRATWAEAAAVLNQQMEWEFDSYQLR